MAISNILRGIGGELEIGRVLLAGSGIAAVLTPIAFQFLDMAHNAWKFDVTAWCVAYPGGLAALNGIGVFTLGKKDRDVATARVTTAEAVKPEGTT